MCPRSPWSGPSRCDFWGRAVVILEWKVHGGSHSITRESWFVATVLSSSESVVLGPAAWASLGPPSQTYYWIWNWRRGEGEWFLSMLNQALEGILMLQELFFRKNWDPHPAWSASLDKSWKRTGVKIDFTFMHLLASRWTQPKLRTGWCDCAATLSLLGETASVTFQIIVLSGEDIGSSQL